MKGVILCGGSGSRLGSLTKVTNKHLLPVHKKPMIYYSIEKLVIGGIREIMIITGMEHIGSIVSLLGSGHDFGCEFTYKVQDAAGGIAQALGLTESFVGLDRVVVLLGDNIFEDDLTPFIEEFRMQENGAKILIKEVSDPHRYGVVELNDKRIVSIEEKPKSPKSNFCVTGVYFYDHNVFHFIKGLKPSNRGELEITDVNNLYASCNQLTFNILDGYWTDAGTFQSLYRASDLVMKTDV